MAETTEDRADGLPAFELDCRDWIVVQPEGEDLPDDENVGGPVLAMLSTMIVDTDIHEATGVITLGILDAGDGPSGSAVDEVAVLEDPDGPDASRLRRYVVSTPTSSAGPRLALVAEFTLPERGTDELDRRVDALMHSFRWRAA